MTIEWLHPGLVLIVGAWLLPFLKGGLKRAAMLALPSAALLLCFLSETGDHGAVSFLGQDLVLGRVPELLAAFTSLLVLVLGGVRVMEGAMTIGMLIAFQVLLRRFQAPVDRRRKAQENRTCR